MFLFECPEPSAGLLAPLKIHTESPTFSSPSAITLVKAPPQLCLSWTIAASSKRSPNFSHILTNYLHTAAKTIFKNYWIWPYYTSFPQTTKGVCNINKKDLIYTDWIIPGIPFLVLVAAPLQGPAVWAGNWSSWHMRENLENQRCLACRNKKSWGILLPPFNI